MGTVHVINGKCWNYERKRIVDEMPASEAPPKSKAWFLWILEDDEDEPRRYIGHFLTKREMMTYIRGVL